MHRRIGAGQSKDTVLSILSTVRAHSELDVLSPNTSLHPRVFELERNERASAVLQTLDQQAGHAFFAAGLRSARNGACVRRGFGR